MMTALRQRTILTRVMLARLSLISVREGSCAYVSTRKLSCESAAEDTRGPRLSQSSLYAPAKPRSLVEFRLGNRWYRSKSEE